MELKPYYKKNLIYIWSLACKNKEKAPPKRPLQIFRYFENLKRLNLNYKTPRIGHLLVKTRPKINICLFTTQGGREAKTSQKTQLHNIILPLPVSNKKIRQLSTCICNLLKIHRL